MATGVAYQLLRPRVPVVTAIRQTTHTGRQKSQLYPSAPVTDGARVYFDEFADGKYHIAQVSTTGGDVSYLDVPQLTNPFVQSISEDGSKLLVFEANSGTGERSYWLFSLPDGSIRRVPGLYPFMMFLPGSDQIAYFHAGDWNRLFASDLDGRGAHLLAKLPSGKTLLALSPDGNRIRCGTDNTKLWESGPDGSGRHRILREFKEPACCANWSADGRLFLFSSPSSGVYNLWAVNESGWARYRLPSRPTQLTSGPVSFQWAMPSRGGKRIYALGLTLRGELSVYDSKSRLFGKYLNGVSAGFTDLSRDGHWVAYVTHPQGDLWRSRIDGSERLQLTYPPIGPVVNPKWSPDGRFIAFAEWVDQKKIYLVSADGGAPLLLASGNLEPADPGWSPDGKQLVYGGGDILVTENTPNEETSEVRILDLSSEESKTVPGSQGLFSPRWSPDGRYLVAESGDMRQIFLYDFASGHWRSMTMPKLRGTDYVGWPAWSHDSRYVYFMSGVNVYKLSIAAGQPELVASASGVEIACPVFGWADWFGLTPDDHILMMLDRSVDEVYALDVEYR